MSKHIHRNRGILPMNGHLKVRNASYFFLACATGLVAPSVLAAAQDPIPLERAAEVFREASDVASGAAGLWSEPLDGPLLLADRETRTVVANGQAADGSLERRGDVWVGRLDESVGIANTGVTWAGTRWTMVVWPVPAGRYERTRLLAHEMFHRIQPELGLVTGGALPEHLDRAEGRRLLRLEWRALQRAVGMGGEARRQAVADALAFRRQRQALQEGAADSERLLELNEGLAEDTGVRAAIPPEARAGWVLALLEDHDVGARHGSVVRNFAYASGPAYGALLDRADPDWREGLTADSDLGALLAAAYDVDPGHAVPRDRIVLQYDGRALAEEERARERVREEARARQAARFRDGPVLRLPVGEDFGYGFDPNRVEPFEGGGSIYGNARVRDTWGVLQAGEAGLLLLRRDGLITGVVVPAPADPSLRPLEGDDWSLELAEGWTLAPGERPGDWVVRRGG